MSGSDPEDHVIWKGRPGWVRVTVGQMAGADDLEVRLFVAAEEAATEEATRVGSGGEWIAGPFVETAEAVSY